MKKKMTKREFEQIIALYEEARDFAKTTGKLKEILAKLEKVTVILQRLETFQNLSAMLDLFEKQSWVMKEYLTIDEVAAYLDVSRWKIRRISADKVLPIYKPTNKIYIKKDDLLEYIKCSKRMSQEELQEYARRFLNESENHRRQKAIGRKNKRK